ncbi:unnamed protein product [Closterium sp. NIES-65]|nr:unnamed protein product [Closterium sp. NIES-65]
MEVVLSSRAKLKPAAKGLATDGVITMTPTCFSWVPANPSAAARLDVPLASIKCEPLHEPLAGQATMQWSKETPSATTALLKFSPHADPAVRAVCLPLPLTPSSTPQPLTLPTTPTLPPPHLLTPSSSHPLTAHSLIPSLPRALIPSLSSA